MVKCVHVMENRRSPRKAPHRQSYWNNVRVLVLIVGTVEVVTNWILAALMTLRELFSLIRVLVNYRLEISSWATIPFLVEGAFSNPSASSHDVGRTLGLYLLHGASPGHSNLDLPFSKVNNYRIPGLTIVYIQLRALGKEKFWKKSLKHELTMCCE